jgi:hypothetical protein
MTDYERLHPALACNGEHADAGRPNGRWFPWLGAVRLVQLLLLPRGGCLSPVAVRRRRSAASSHGPRSCASSRTIPSAWLACWRPAPPARRCPPPGTPRQRQAGWACQPPSGTDPHRWVRRRRPRITWQAASWPVDRLNKMHVYLRASQRAAVQRASAGGVPSD